MAWCVGGRCSAAVRRTKPNTTAFGWERTGRAPDCPLKIPASRQVGLGIRRLTRQPVHRATRDAGAAAGSLTWPLASGAHAIPPPYRAGRQSHVDSRRHGDRHWRFVFHRIGAGVMLLPFRASAAGWRGWRSSMLEWVQRRRRRGARCKRSRGDRRLDRRLERSPEGVGPRGVEVALADELGHVVVL